MNAGPHFQLKKLKRQLKESREHLALLLRFIDKKGLEEELLEELIKMKEELYGIRTDKK